MKTFISDYFRSLSIFIRRRARFHARWINAFRMGFREFREDCGMTWNNDPYHPFSVAYDKGRDLAHRLTFRVYDFCTEN